MNGGIAPRWLAIPLLIALFIAPAAVQEQYISFWTPWGQPLLLAAAVFAAFVLVVFCPPAVARRIRRQRDAAQQRRAAVADSESSQALIDDLDESSEEFDMALRDALTELQPENLMDLARALHEMGRQADTLEVLAQVVERERGDNSEEVARALRRMRQTLSQEDSQDE